jgi:hypothetical protein
MHNNLMSFYNIFQPAEPENDDLGPAPMNEETGLIANNTDSQDISISMVSYALLISNLIYHPYIYFLIY